MISPMKIASCIKIRRISKYEKLGKLLSKQNSSRASVDSRREAVETGYQMFLPSSDLRK